MNIINKFLNIFILSFQNYILLLNILIRKSINFHFYFFLLIYNRVVDKMKVVYPFYESVIIKKPKKVNV